MNMQRRGRHRFNHNYLLAEEPGVVPDKKYILNHILLNKKSSICFLNERVMSYVFYQQKMAILFVLFASSTIRPS